MLPARWKSLDEKLMATDNEKEDIHMNLMKTAAFFAVLMLSVSLAGCGGGGAKIQQSTTTLGQELQDLDAAYKKGLLSDKEYKKAREDLIDKYTD